MACLDAWQARQRDQLKTRYGGVNKEVRDSRAQSRLEACFEAGDEILLLIMPHPAQRISRFVGKFFGERQLICA